MTAWTVWFGLLPITFALWFIYDQLKRIADYLERLTKEKQ